MIRTETISLAASGLTAGGAGKYLPTLRGGYLALGPDSHASAVLEVATGKDGVRGDFDWVPLTPGAVLTVPFEGLRVRLASGTPATAGRTATLIASDKPIALPTRAQALDADGQAVFRDQPGSASTGKKAITDSASGEVLAANADRREAVVYNPAGGSDVYLGLGAAATVAGGMLLPAGGSFATRYTGAINAICDTGGSATLRYAEESYV